MRKVLRVLVFCVLLAIGSLGTFLFLSTSVCYQITERYTFSAGQPGVGIHLAIMLPRSGPYQTVGNVTVDWPGDSLRESHESVDVIMLDGVTGNDGVVVALLTYDVALRQGKARWNAPVKDEHLEPELEVESDAPMLVAKAKEIGGDSSRESAYQMYAFTAQHLSWPTGSRIGGNDSALSAYETGIGVCSEHANLMTALCRASDIPAKSISGLFLPSLLPPYTTSTKIGLHPGGAHAWVEVYSEGGWEMVDPTWATNSPLDRLWFGRTFGQHLSYGETREHDRVYDEMMVWGESRGDLAVAMSAPLKFVSTVEKEDVTVNPVASVKKTQDVRWFAAAGLYIAMVVAFALLERRLRRIKHISVAG